MSARRTLFSLILPLVSALVAIAIVELVLALFYPIPYSLERNMYFEPDPYTGYRHRPNGQGFYPNGVPAIANSLGFRDDEMMLAKPPGTFRILMLGDSFTVGANVAQDEAYPQVLERLLNADRPTRIEVINAGVGGYDPFHYAQFAEHYAARFEPDLVLVGFFAGNDAYSRFSSVDETLTAVLGRRVPRDAGKGIGLLLKVWAYENLHLVRALVNRGPSSLRFQRESCDVFGDYYLAVQEKRLVNHLARPDEEQRELMRANVMQIARIASFARERNGDVVVVLIPDENQLNPALQARLIPAERRGDYDFGMPQAALKPLLAGASIAYLDLFDAFRDDPRCLYMDDTHWTAAGHAFAAERIADFLSAGAYLP